MKTIKTIITALFLMAGTAAQAQLVMNVKTDTQTDQFQLSSRFVLDMTQMAMKAYTKSEAKMYSSSRNLVLYVTDKEDAIKDIKADENKNKKDGQDAVYDLTGRKIEKPQRGINIIRMSDGTIRKVLQK